MSYSERHDIDLAVSRHYIEHPYTLRQEVADISQDTGKFVYEHRGTLAGGALAVVATILPETRVLALAQHQTPSNYDLFDKILESPVTALEIGAVSSLLSQVTTEVTNVNAHKQAIEQNQIPPEQLDLYIKSMPKRFFTKVIANSFAEAVFIYLGSFGLKHQNLAKDTIEQVILTAASLFSLASGIWPNSWKKGLQEVAAESVAGGIR